MNRHIYFSGWRQDCRLRPSEFVRILREGSWFDSGCTDEGT